MDHYDHSGSNRPHSGNEVSIAILADGFQFGHMMLTWIYRVSDFHNTNPRAPRMPLDGCGTTFLFLEISIPESKGTKNCFEPKRRKQSRRQIRAHEQPCPLSKKQDRPWKTPQCGPWASAPRTESDLDPDHDQLLARSRSVQTAYSSTKIVGGPQIVM